MRSERKSRKCRRVGKARLKRQQRLLLRQKARRRSSALSSYRLRGPPEPAKPSSLISSEQLMKFEEAAPSLRAPFDPVHCLNIPLASVTVRRL